MEALQLSVEKYKRPRLCSSKRDSSSKDSCECRTSSSVRSSSRRHDSHRSRREIPEDQCVSLFPCAKSPNARQDKHSKENFSHCKAPQTAGSREYRSRWITKESKCSPLAKTKDPNRMDMKDEFPPLGISSYTPENVKDWGSIVDDEECKSSLTGKQPNPRYKRKLVLSESQEDSSRESKRIPLLTDPHKLQQRQKQIDIGKNTLAYGRYSASVSSERRTNEDPQTPNKFKACSTRSWVGQIKIWRRKLHVWDPPRDGQQGLFSSPGENKLPTGDMSCEAQEDLFSSSSQSSAPFSDDIKMEVEDDDDCMSTSTPSSIDDIFKEFDLDSCLMNDGLPL